MGGHYVMGIILEKIRVRNFRSIKDMDVVLDKTNILIGQNNSGKSNILKAIDIAFGGYKEVSEADIFVSPKEKLSQDKVAIIDVLLKPTDKGGGIMMSFSDFWANVFTDAWIATSETDGDSVGIRTVIQFDKRKKDYVMTRRPILAWNNSIDEAQIGLRKSFGSDMLDSLVSFYMDAQRDAVDDIRNRRSYFGRATSQSDLSEELIAKLERQLDSINTEIIKSIPALTQTNQKMSSIGSTLGTEGSVVEIEPLTRKISDLHKGMDIVYSDIESEKFSISQHGMGTRSWISFLTLGAYVDWHIAEIKKDEDGAEVYIILAIEEPEAHLHPQAQRQLYSQLLEFNGQKIISTHSPSVLAQADISNIIHIEKKHGETHAIRFNDKNFNSEEINRIQREVINTRGELLFSNALVLCEGITEEQALPLYFKEYFGIDAICCGINIIGLGGQNYKTFLNFIKEFNIPWFIFSDGENSTIKTVTNAVKAVTNTSLEDLRNVIILNNGEDYESHLLASGYIDEIISAINECEQNTNYFDDFLSKTNHQSYGRTKTNKPCCKTCGQPIYESKYRNYDGDDGKKKAVYDCCTKYGAKAKYATYIAKHIIAHTDRNKRIPPKVKTLLSIIAQTLHLKKQEAYADDKAIR